MLILGVARGQLDLYLSDVVGGWKLGMHGGGDVKVALGREQWSGWEWLPGWRRKGVVVLACSG